MPAAPRPKGKATTIFYDVLGTPQNMKKKRGAKRKMVNQYNEYQMRSLIK